ncbi:hypothetical protein SEA_MABODAMACA_39 [Microbacterium phage Mabodamaca]|uniref:Uncharacterized protein n=1 Tax=Microbacterium phage Mabodamaca TaxID=3078574 RepID=A0AA96SDU6_9CAUD|nr:hypothetical protein SEA_MABODAMACA_39 [Microbacterium phage Mabodamaca]
MTETRTPPLPGMVWESIPTIDGEPDYSESSIRNFTDDLDKATVITSRVAGQTPTLQKYKDAGYVPRHKVILDLDLPAKLVPSTTEGHFHLYIDHEVDWEDYQDLLVALERCGLVETGYVNASLARGHTAARMPWVQKGEPPVSSEDF